MRIAVLHNRYRQPGGEDTVVSQEVQLLEECGHEVIEYYADNRSISSPGPVLAGRTVWSRPMADALGKFFDEHRPDLVHIHNFFPLLSPSVHAAASRREIPVVQTLHNFRLLCPAATFFRDGGPCTLCLGRSIPWPAVQHACYRNDRPATVAVATMLTAHRMLGTWRQHVDAFIALTGFARDQFLTGGLPESRVHIKPNFARDVRDGGGDRSSKRGCAVYVGRLSAEKGVRTLVSAWHDVPLPLVVLGDGPLRDELMRQAPANVTFRGRVSRSEVYGTLRESSFAVVPSICLEGFPMAVLDAYMMGVPVLGSDLGSLAEVVEDGVTGRLVAHGDAQSLARGARLLSSDPELERLAAGARAVYVARYSAAAAIDRLEEIYREAIRTRRLRART
jgi:glycosyltransferase involved in cell wall biosynthesis